MKNLNYHQLMFSLRHPDSDEFIFGGHGEILALCAVLTCSHWFEVEPDDDAMVHLCHEHADVTPTITLAGGKP